MPLLRGRPRDRRAVAAGAVRAHHRPVGLDRLGARDRASAARHGGRPALVEAAAGALHGAAVAARRRRAGGMAGGRPGGRDPGAGARLSPGPAAGGPGGRRRGRPRARPERALGALAGARLLGGTRRGAVAVGGREPSRRAARPGARPRLPGRARAARSVAVRRRLRSGPGVAGAAPAAARLAGRAAAAVARAGLVGLRRPVPRRCRGPGQPGARRPAPRPSGAAGDVGNPPAARVGRAP